MWRLETDIRRLDRQSDNGRILLTSLTVRRGSSCWLPCWRQVVAVCCVCAAGVAGVAVLCVTPLSGTMQHMRRNLSCWRRARNEIRPIVMCELLPFFFRFFGRSQIFSSVMCTQRGQNLFFWENLFLENLKRTQNLVFREFSTSPETKFSRQHSLIKMAGTWP